MTLKISDFDTEKLCGELTDRGYNQTTASGRPFWVADPRIEDIRVDDIAAHLSRMCRFAGAVRNDIEIYSVAQHSLLVSSKVPPDFALEGLLHDAAEYVIGDMVKPQKRLFPERDKYEHAIDAVIRRKFCLPPDLSPIVKRADFIAVATERRDVCAPNQGVDWGDMPEPWPEKIVPMGIFEARDAFLQRFHELVGV